MKLVLSFILCVFTCLSQAQQPSQALTALADTPQAPAFNLHDLNGKKHQLSDYAGKPLIVNFWATWCPPCREEMPSMQRAWEQIQENAAMLAINVGESEDKIFLFLGSYPLEFPVLLDTDSAVLNAWPVMGLPTTFVLDPQGRIIYRAIGGRDWDDPEIINKINLLSQ